MRKSPSIWFDFENAPHVWVFSKVIEHLKGKCYPLILTARDFSCTVGLCRRHGYQVDVVGLSGQGKNRYSKAFRVMERALRLCACMLSRRKNLAVAVSHGSRSQIIAARLLNVPVISLDDYEYSDQSFVRFVDHLLVPFPIPREIWGDYANKVTHYPGLKEELYLCGFAPCDLGLQLTNQADYARILFRPEGRFSHYRSPKSAAVHSAILQHLANNPESFLILMPRDPEQARALVEFCEARALSYWLPQEVIDGPTLIWNSDLVISGGGTMTREAAVLGVPSYSFFGGRWGAIDGYLRSKGRIVPVLEEKDAVGIKVNKHRQMQVSVSKDALEFVTSFLENFVR